jgi:hypothetical protein
MSAQAFQSFDREAALSEMFRVAKRGGVIAVWWKQLMTGERARSIRDETFAEMGLEPPRDPAGFREFYAAPLQGHALRVFPWRITVPVEEFVADERSRPEVSKALGEQMPRYLRRLEESLRAGGVTSGDSLPLSFMQYLYLGKKP